MEGMWGRKGERWVEGRGNGWCGRRREVVGEGGRGVVEGRGNGWCGRREVVGEGGGGERGGGKEGKWMCVGVGERLCGRRGEGWGEKGEERGCGGGGERGGGRRERERVGEEERAWDDGKEEESVRNGGSITLTIIHYKSNILVCQILLCGSFNVQFCVYYYITYIYIYIYIINVH